MKIKISKSQWQEIGKKTGWLNINDMDELNRSEQEYKIFAELKKILRMYWGHFNTYQFSTFSSLFTNPKEMEKFIEKVEKIFDMMPGSLKLDFTNEITTVGKLATFLYNQGIKIKEAA